MTSRIVLLAPIVLLVLLAGCISPQLIIDLMDDGPGPNPDPNPGTYDGDQELTPKTHCSSYTDDHVVCGYCPSTNKCRFCEIGQLCILDSDADPCGDVNCYTPPDDSYDPYVPDPYVPDPNSFIPDDGYYVSCSQCTVGPYHSYSYENVYQAVCLAWYDVCVQAGCQKILDNCR